MKKLTTYHTRIIKSLGLRIDIWSPGDGKSRYKIIPEGQDYFSASYSYPVFLGFKELCSAIDALAIVVDHLPHEKQRTEAA